MKTNSLINRISQLWGVMFLFVGLTACTQEPTEVAKAKLLAFNPQEYLKTKSILEGEIVHKSPGDVYIILEDDTGKVLVSAHEIPKELNCPVGANARVSGSLAELTVEGRYYFVMDELLSCNQGSAL